ncbi:uncharacterized protein LOC131336700 isoform X4 [Rhododendron vialii]|uniref:uncharacterized protein LOC131336700 isoform X4 n=1 Tax=Rhododendron vialii TaxID=182163 RepID=UPI00265F91C4|nr:uncharacterized protein LOC131336700 isoform X4 [Rhododendron vialii]XP_058228618.1 uncharacterized protein LOC131336700 isoform X4 [Rhododendron vialii]
MAAAAAPLLQSPSLIQLPLQFQIHHPPSSSSSLSLLSRAAKLVSHPPIFRSPRPRRPNCKRLVPCSHANASIQAQGSFDPDLRSVLELATDSELYELEQILFGPSYFSPLLKSIKTQADVDYFMIEEDLDERDAFIATLESRFFFLAADARSTIRGWRPSYRNVLLGVRAKLNILCSRKLSTEDLEAEIFLHLLQEYSSDESGTLPSSWESSKLANSHGSLEVGLSHWKVQAASALRVGAAELRAVILKGGGILTLGKLYNLLVRKLMGRVFVEAANYQIRNDVIRKGGQFAAVTLKSRVALLTAKQALGNISCRCCHSNAWN